MPQNAPPNQVRFLTIYPLVVLPLFLSMIDQSIVATALPQIANDFGIGASAAWVLVVYLMAAAISAPVAGRIADAVGLRLILALGITLAVLGSLLCAAAANIEQLLAARILQGIGGGANHALALAVINKTVPARQRAKYQGFIASVSVTANMAGPLFGAFLAYHFGWRAVFLLTPPLGVIALAFVGRLSKDLNSKAPFRFDTAGFIALTVTVLSVFGLLFTLKPPFQNLYVFAPICAAIAVVGLAAFVVVERRATTPLLPLGLLANPSIWRANLMALCQGALVGSLIATTPLYFSVMRGVTQADLGWVLLPMTIGLGIGGITWGQVVGRSGRTSPVTATVMSACAILIWVGLAFWPAMATSPISLWLGVVTFCVGSIMVVVQVTVSNQAGPALQATASGAINLARSIGAALGSAIVPISLSGTVYFLGGTPAPEAFVDQQAALLGTAFSATFFVISMFALVCASLAATMPVRRIA